MKNKLFAYVTVALLLAVGAAAVVTPLNGEDSSADTTAIGLSVGQTKTAAIYTNEKAFSLTTNDSVSWTYNTGSGPTIYGTYDTAVSATDYSFKITKDTSTVGLYTVSFTGSAVATAQDLTLTYTITVNSVPQSLSYAFQITISDSISSLTIQSNGSVYGASAKAATMTSNGQTVTASDNSFTNGNTYYLDVNGTAYKLTASSATTGTTDSAINPALSSQSVNYVDASTITSTLSLIAGQEFPTVSIVPNVTVTTATYYATGLFAGVAMSSGGSINGAILDSATSVTDAIIFLTVYVSDSATGDIKTFDVAMKYTMTAAATDFAATVKAVDGTYTSISNGGTATAVSGASLTLKFDQSVSVRIINPYGEIKELSATKDVDFTIAVSGTGDYVIIADNGLYSQTYHLYVIDDVKAINASIHVKCA